MGAGSSTEQAPGVLDHVRAAVAALDAHGLGWPATDHHYPRPEGQAGRHPTEAALDPLRGTGWMPVVCSCGNRLCWAVLPESGTTVYPTGRIKGPSKRVGNESDAIDGAGRGPMFDAAARAHITRDRWRLECRSCPAVYPIKADTMLRLLLRAIATAEIDGGGKPSIDLGRR